MQVSWHSLACSPPPHFIMLPPQILITDLRLPSTHVPFGVWSFSISGRSLKFYNWDFFFQKRKTLTQMVLTLLSLSGVAATCNSKRSSVSMLANSSPFSSEPRNKKKKMTEVRSMIHFLSFRMWQLPQPYSLPSSCWAKMISPICEHGNEAAGSCWMGAAGALPPAVPAGASPGRPEGRARAGRGLSCRSWSLLWVGGQ